MSNSFSETDLLAKIFPLIKINPNVLVPPGDDCAVFSAGSMNLAVTVDQVIEEKHYLANTSAELVGRKLMARNLSDIAAMGGKPLFAVLASASFDKSEEWLIDFHKGVIDEGNKFGVTLIGGDLAGAVSDTVSSLTLIGEVSGKGILRSGAQSGDVLICTGQFGASFETEHHLNFTPRIEEGQWLAGFATSMIDVTDGLMIDLKRVCLKSELGAVLHPEMIPRRSVESGIASLKEALTDGEDYELLFSIPPDLVETVQNEWPFSTNLTMIGRFSSELPIGIFSDEKEDLISLYGEGFDHFK